MCAFSLVWGSCSQGRGYTGLRTWLMGPTLTPARISYPQSVSPFDWHAQASLVTVVKWNPESPALVDILCVLCVCMWLCVCAVVRVVTVGVSLMWHHRRGHVTVSRSPRRRGAVWVMRPLGLQWGQRWCSQRCTMRASVRVFVQQTERLHTNTAERRLVLLFGVWCCWFVVSHACVYFLLW